jgi:hypothetical protein
VALSLRGVVDQQRQRPQRRPRHDSEHADAQAAILRIKGEGEGTEGSPDQPPAAGTKFAHYYVFKEILTGKTLVQTNGQWAFTGAAIPFPAVFNFTQSNAQPDPSLAFNQALSQLLIGLQTCWTSGTLPDTGAMFGLQGLGQGLIQQGIRPEFLSSPRSSQLRAAPAGNPAPRPNPSPP